MRPVLLTVLLFLARSDHLAGQRFAPRPGPPSKAAIAANLRLDERLAAAGRRDLRWPGTVVGALGLGIAGGLAGAAYCGNSENGPRSCTGTTIAFAAGGAAIGGLVGHGVGRLIKR